MSPTYSLNSSWWEPVGGTPVRPGARPEPGSLVCFNRAVWRVAAVHDIAQANWNDADMEMWQRLQDSPGRIWQPFHPPYALRVVPAKGGKERSFYITSLGRHYRLWALPEHYPACVDCGEPYPCTERTAAYQGAKAAKHLERMERVLPGCCWHCAEPITERQKAVHFDGDNLDLPGGPAVVFHLRRSCRHAAGEYEKRWAAADPTRRRTLSCDGRISIHVDGWSCTDPACPGRNAAHDRWMVCAKNGTVCLRCKDARERQATA